MRIGNILYTLLFATIEEKDRAVQVRQYRFGILFAMGLMYIAMSLLIDPMKSEEEATVSVGVLTRVGESRKARVIEVKTSDETIRIHSYLSTDLIMTLRQHTGNTVKIWTYTRLGPALWTENYLVQIEANNKKLIDWSDEGLGERKKPYKLISFLILIALILLFRCTTAINKITQPKVSE